VSGGLTIDEMLLLWGDGERRLKAADPRTRRAMDAIVEGIVAELRRRLGGPFDASELGLLYLQGTDWCFELATRVAPQSPEAWDMPTVVGAAFSAYVRRARDFGGGRRRMGDDET
jgi:hypothetical protein